MLLATLVVSGCGEGEPAAMTGPTTLASFLEPPPPAVEGMWSGPLVLASVTGGTGAVADAGALDCVGTAIRAQMQSDNISSLVIDRDGSAVTGRLTSAETGLAVAYAGVAGDSQLVLSADSLNGESLNFLCQGGATATLVMVASSIIADFPSVPTPPTLTGTVAHTFNVFAGASGVLEGVVTQFTFTLQRR